MDKSFQRTIRRFQQFRSEKLRPIGMFFARKGISAGMLTFCSLLSGLLAIGFLFEKYSIFLLGAFLHVLFDLLDGVVARESSPTVTGRYYDLGTDGVITILALAKSGWFLQDWYAYAVAGLFFLAYAIHFLSRLNAPIIYMRSASLGVLLVGTFPLFPFTTEFLTFGYLVGGGFTVFSLARQLQWFLQKGA